MQVSQLLKIKKNIEFLGSPASPPEYDFDISDMVWEEKERKKIKEKFIPQKYISPYRKGNKKENKLLLIHNKAAKLENKS